MTVPSLADFDPLGFDPLVTEWFVSRFAGPTEPQTLGWPEIRAGRDVLKRRRDKGRKRLTV